MKRILTGGALAVAFFTLMGCASTSTQLASQSASAAPAADASAAASSLSGTWQGSLADPQGEKHPIELVLEVNGNAVTGTLAGGPPDGAPRAINNGKVERNKLSFDISFTGPTGEQIVVMLEGTVTGNRIRGVHGSPSMPMDLTWEATKR